MRASRLWPVGTSHGAVGAEGAGEMKLRFTWNEDSQCWNVRARRKSTGKWETIGICHPAAKDAIKAGKTELIQWNVIPLIVVGRMTRTEAGETRTAQVHQ